MSSWKIWAVGAVSTVAVACGPPTVVPVAPPGLEYKTEAKDDLPAEALGEARVATDVTPSAVKVMPVAKNDPTEPGKPRTTDTGLTYETLKAGDGPVADAGKLVLVHYTGTLTDGTEFDSSRTANRPFEFVIGGGGVIAGWDQGVAGMKVGERRKLVIPAKLGYGSQEQGKIPANSTLIFDIELLKIIE